MTRNQPSYKVGNMGRGDRTLKYELPIYSSHSFRGNTCYTSTTTKDKSFEKPKAS